ncbi:hypothetical protein JK358_38650 [Nocardia sp. 2]|uniref:Uncharacterized protein n=1 Tax=Nocardia acididurans TaxID=2802282 RepID=A0ABS1MLK8_9NOCA|nr:hypothetical protein [Nocardia acididurans]MBL1080333.1 hypothetical protein [Nocardia acididurans]
MFAKFLTEIVRAVAGAETGYEYPTQIQIDPSIAEAIATEGLWDGQYSS